MRKYEVVCIFHPDLDEEAFKAAHAKVREWIADSGGNVDKEEIWGRRRLAFSIRKKNEGQYVLLNVSMDPASLPGLNQNMRFLESLLRHMITVVD